MGPFENVLVEKPVRFYFGYFRSGSYTDPLSKRRVSSFVRRNRVSTTFRITWLDTFFRFQK